MSLFTDASLVMIPSGIKDQKVYSVTPTDGSGDLTFSRASNATRVNSSGLVEKVRENLALYSQDATQAVWTKSNLTVTGNTTTAPDGTLTADTLDDQSTSAYGRLSQSFSFQDAEYTWSFFIKKTTGALTNYAGAEIGDLGQYLIIDTTNGTGLRTSSIFSFSIVSYNSDWWRVSLTATITAGTKSCQVWPAISSDGTTITGTATGSNVFWGFQLETGVMTDYIATTTSAVSVGPVSGLPRLDYSGGASCPSLLLEPQRTNLALFSEQFDNAAWIKGVNNATVTVTANQSIAPDGTMSADKVVLSAVTGAGHYAVVAQAFTATTAAFSGSFYFKGENGGEVIYISYTKDGVNYTRQLCTLTTSWQRFTLTSTLTAGADNIQFGVDRRDGSQGATPAQTFYAWGAQCEAGAYATSYIPTLSSAVTRVADTYQKGGFGNTSTAGTLYYEFEATNINSPNGQYLISLFAGSSVGGAFFADSNAITITGNGPQIQGYNNSYGQLLFTSTPAIGATVKVALRYDGTNVVAFLNGVKQTVFADTAVGVKNAIRVNNGENGTQATRQLLFFPTALSDADCITLTA